MTAAADHSPSLPGLRTPCWVALADPDDETIARVRAATGLRVPTSANLLEIENSSRFYVDNGAVYVSLPVFRADASGELRTTPFGAILTPDLLITVQYAPLPGFDALSNRIAAAAVTPSAIGTYLALIEGLVEVVADTIERGSADLDRLATTIYNKEPGLKQTRRDAELRATLQDVGRISARVSKMRDLLNILGRSFPFVQANAPWIPADQHERFKTVRTDVTWLEEQLGHATRQAQFLQDATIGFIGIEQSHIIKVLAVVATVGVPPTLLASMWGMNFEHMPELAFEHAYPLAIAAIVLSALIPLAWFRRAGWL